MRIIAALSVAFALASCGVEPAFAQEAPPSCGFTYDDAVAKGNEAAKAPGVRFIDFSLADSKKLIDAINAIPPTDVTYEAERFAVLIHDDPGFVAAALAHNGCVIKIFKLPMSAWRELQKAAFGTGT